MLGLKREEKDAIGILSIGTFLEYFDLLLYIHMITLLNNIFFAPADKANDALLASFAYCITYLVRPFGSVLIGWLGDIKGRKFTIQMTLYMTAISSITIFLLPPYEAIGVAASIIITLCRITQSLSSLGERTGADIYLTELIKGKMQYVAIGCVVVLAMVGSLAALVIAHYATLEVINWRYAFLLGGIIAVAGSYCRSKLRDTTYILDDVEHKVSCKKLWNIIINSFFMQNLHVICWYVSFMYCSEILRERFNYTDAQVIANNLKLTCTILITCIVHTLLFFKYSPIKLSFIRNHLMLALVLASPIILNDATEPLHILLLQIGLMVLGANEIAAIAIRTKNTPKIIRFRTEAIVGAMSGLTISLMCTFGINLTKQFLGNYTLILFLLPLALMYHFGLKYYAKLDATNKDGCHVYYNDEGRDEILVKLNNENKKKVRGRPRK